MMAFSLMIILDLHTLKTLKTTRTRRLSLLGGMLGWGNNMVAIPQTTSYEVIYIADYYNIATRPKATKLFYPKYHILPLPQCHFEIQKSKPM